MRIEAGSASVYWGHRTEHRREKSMSRKMYSITDMNGYTGEDSVTFSYDRCQNETEKSAGAYSIADMNGYTGADRISFGYTSMNGQ